jgi:type I restriction enzyme S subunit
VKTIGDVLELAYGKPLKAEHRMGGGVGVYGSNGLVGRHDERLVTGPGIVVGRKGNPGIVTWAHGDFYPIDTTFFVVPTSECKSLHFLYYALTLQDLGNLSADSAVPGLNRNHAYMSNQTIPPSSVLECFDAQIAPIFDMMYANSEESRDLATLRDTLLPKLLSGEISAPAAEELIAAST